MRSLSLQQITVIEADPLSLVSIAHELGCRTVSVFIHVASGLEFPMVTHTNKAGMLARMNDTGIHILAVESFLIHANTDVMAFEPALALAGELGARFLAVHVVDDDDSRAVDRLGQLCERAAVYRLGLGVEFMPLTSACATIERAAYFVRRVGQRNFGIALDALHLARSGGTPADVAALEPELFAYAQLCDGTSLNVSSDYIDEARFDRLVPGEGCFPLAALIEALPAGTPLEIEVPSEPLRKQGMPPLERARRAAVATRALLDSATPMR
jgi:sugar phosphate isomerase/epimerase